MELVSFEKITAFQKTIWQFYAQQGRIFEWRSVDDPYLVFISEVMLQQTQTSRVAQKFPVFVRQFPTFHALASASLKEVLLAWQGLGYNRRGKFLQQAAQEIVKNHQGILPDDPDVLSTLPGIGYATANSITAFAYNKPTIFIETNIRSVFIYFFFTGKEKVHDKELFPLVAAVVDKESPREWYYALMDYGVMLKKTLKNPSRKSVHHTVQSKFEGSDRQIRGAILRELTKAHEPISLKKMIMVLKKPAKRVKRIAQDLINEKLIERVYNDGLIIREKTN